jgi:hypothetical protein
MTLKEKTSVAIAMAAGGWRLGFEGVCWGLGHAIHRG